MSLRQSIHQIEADVVNHFHLTDTVVPIFNNIGPILTQRLHFNIHQDSEEGMVAGLSIRAIKDYIDTDDVSGLTVFLQNRHVQIDETDEDGWSGLFYAVDKGNMEVVKTLVEHGTDVNQEDCDHCSPLHYAARQGHVAICATLLKAGCHIDNGDGSVWSPFLWACYSGHAAVAELLMDNGADVNSHGVHHCSGLVWAAGRGHRPIVQLLLGRGARVDSGDKYGTTGLIWAARKGHRDIVEVLLKAMAQVNTTGMYSWTPLLVAVRGNYPSIVSMLLEHSPNVNAVDQDGLTALAIACKEGFTDIAYQLMSAGAYVNLQDRGGDTNLILASKGGHKSIVEALLKRYADLDTKGKDNKTCLYWAVEKNHPHIVKVLLNANPDLEVATSEGDTALLRAVKNRNTEIVQLLLEKKAKLTATDKRGDTALHVAMRARSKTIVELLLRNPKNSQLLHKPNRAGETPYNIDLASHKSLIGQMFGGRKLNTNEDAENMLGYDLYGSALADILTEPSLSMPISVGLYAKWGSGKSFLLRKLREEMKNFVRDWVDPSFHFSYLLLIVIIHIASIAGFFAWIICFYMPETIETTNSFVVMTIVFFVTIALCYLLMLGIWQATFKSDWYTLYNIHVKLAQLFNDLKLLVSVVFCHPPGPQNSQSTDQAQPLKLFFTDNTKVNTSAEGENCVIQMIGSLYDNIEESYGTVTTRLYRAFRPTPVKSTSPIKLRKICCIPYVVLYLFFYILLIAEIILIIMSAKGINSRPADNGSPIPGVDPMQNQTYVPTNQVNIEPTDLEQYVLGVLIALSVILGVIVISNCYSFGQVIKALIFSQRTHLQRAVAKHDIVASEGFVQAVKKEVNLLQEMIKSLDAFSRQQSRLIVVVDGLDSVQQSKVLEVLDTVHSLFSEKGNFIIVLAIDPHIITKAIELNLNKVFMETSIAGGAYLRNMVHLPFFLQNAGLRKVNVAKEIAKNLKAKLIHSSSWIESENIHNDRRTSIDSELGGPLRANSKLKKKHLTGHLESTTNSIASNLNKISSTGGPLELTKMLLTDDYFSDVNPRTMRRLMNIIYVTGKLLKAFNIDFNWHHLASWANITEQWPYRTSWIILYCDEHEDDLDDTVPLRTLYEKIKPMIPTQKELEPMLEMDRDEKKLDVYLSYHKKNLTLATLKVFLPFSINLDPYIKKVIKEEVQNMEELGLPGLSSYSPSSKSYAQSPMYNVNPNVPNKAPLTRRQAAGLSQKYGSSAYPSYPPVVPPYPPGMGGAMPHMKPGFGGPLQGMYPSMMFQYGTYPYQNYPESLNNSLSSFSVRPTLPPELQGCMLSTFTVEMVSQLIRTTEGINQGMVDQYCTTIVDNNVNGRVLLYCQVDELKNVLNMNFGDWELFKLAISALREDESNNRNNGTWRREADTKQDAQVSTHERERENIRPAREETGRRSQTSVEKQVCLEEATVAGMLSTLNEEAQEDILQDELSNVKEQADMSNCPSSDNPRKTSVDRGETEFLFYSELLPNSQTIDIISDESLERGRSCKEFSRQITFSNTPSRKSSYKDVTSEVDSALSIPTSPALLPILPTVSSMKSPSSKSKKKLNLADRAMTVTSVLGVNKPNTLKLEEDDPYAWISHGAQTAPASPHLHRARSQSEGPMEGDSDPGYTNSMLSLLHKSVRRKKGPRRSKTESEADSLVSPDKKDTGSQDKMDKIKRKIRRAMTQSEQGSIPIVHRAKPNQGEYYDFQASRTASPTGSPWDSDESCSSPEQRTVTRRPPADQVRGPPVQTLFQKTESVGNVASGVAGEAQMTTVLPDGSVMPSPEKQDKKLTRQHEIRSSSESK